MAYSNGSVESLLLRATCLLVYGLAAPPGALADGRESVTGIVDQVQLIDASAMSGERRLILHLESGEASRFPHADHVAAGAGVKVRVVYQEASEGGELPVACSAEVLALPLDDDSEDAMHQASQPFEVYRNPGC